MTQMVDLDQEEGRSKILPCGTPTLFTELGTDFNTLGTIEKIIEEAVKRNFPESYAF